MTDERTAITEHGLAVTNPPAVVDGVAYVALPSPTRLQMPDAAEQERDISDAITLLKSAGHPAYAVPNATISGTVQRVACKELWVNPLYERAMRYTPAETAQLSGSLAYQGQLEPVIVAPFADPRRSPRRGGRTLMVISGANRLYSHDLAGKDYIEVVIREFTSFFDALMASVTTKLSVKSAGPVQTGYLVRSLEIAHQVENRQRIEQEETPLEPMPTFDELGKRVGMSVSWLSICRRLIDQPAEILALVEEGKLVADRLRELLRIEDIELRTQTAQQWAAMAVAGAPVSRQDAQRISKRLQQGAGSSDSAELPAFVRTTPQGLLLQGYPSQGVVALGALVRDMHTVLDDLIMAQKERGETPPREWSDLFRYLQRASVQQFAQQVTQMLSAPASGAATETPLASD